MIFDMQKKHGDILNVYRLEKNSGLGNALNYGMKKCKNELVARMDSDDYSLPDRCELQLERFSTNVKLGIIGGYISEFKDSIDEEGKIRNVPTENDAIVKFSKYRTPFNHVSVMFKKEEVINAGGYNEKYHFFEDYYLWVRMLMRGCIGENIDKVIVKVRMSDLTYERRGGIRYAKDLLRFHTWMLKKRWIGIRHFVFGSLSHAIVCLIPNKLRRSIYEVILRE